MANIRKLYEADQTTQLMPQTHEKAVIDNNGTTAETKFHMITDLVNQKQMEVGAVPSDLTPTKDSTNWVPSGGVYNSTPSNEENYTEADLDITDEDGFKLATFYDGDVKTKKFDSKNAPQSANSELYDFDIVDENGNSIVIFEDGQIRTKKFDSADFPDKYVDCIGDSLTMGSANFGWFETKLQELLGNKYTVRNWGVGGENIATIMARLGAAQVVFPSSFVLPSDGSAVQISTKTNPMTSAFNGAAITPLLQGASNDSGHKNRMVNPCYVNGIECTMVYTGSDLYANSPYTLQRNSVGSRDVTFPINTPVYFNTGKQMGKSHITIVWMGTNGGYDTIDELVAAQKLVADYLPNDKYVFVGLHKLTGATASEYEGKMTKQFGNKFFNIREYCCTNMIYDCGITPTSADLENMANGICPSSLLYDSTHFNPTSNAMIGQKLYEFCKQLGYLNA